MTPRPLQPELVLNRLREMKLLLDDLEGIGEVTAGRLEDDRMLRHGVERVLTALVDLAVAVNGHVAAALGNPAPATYRRSLRAAGGAVAVHLPRADLTPTAQQPPALTGRLHLRARLAGVAPAGPSRARADNEHYDNEGMPGTAEGA